MNWEGVWNFLGTMFAFLTKNETVAVLVPFIIFVITLFFVVRKLIGFFVTVTLLLFALASGLAVMNYDAVRDWVQNDIPEEHYIDLKQIMQDFREQVTESLDDVQAQLEELEEEKETFVKVANNTTYLLQRIESQEERIRQLMDATPKPPKKEEGPAPILPL